MPLTVSSRFPTRHCRSARPTSRWKGGRVFPRGRRQHVPLPRDRARFVGETVAVVVAETLNAAKDAADAVIVEYAELPAAVHVTEAGRDDATLIWPELGDNVCVDVPVGDREATEAAFRSAAHVVRIETWIPARHRGSDGAEGSLAHFDRGSGEYTLYAGAGGVVRLRRDLAIALDVSEAHVRVVAGDIGGNFGSKNATYPEYPLLLWAARRLGRPVSWICERRESRHSWRTIKAGIWKLLPSWRLIALADFSRSADRTPATSALMSSPWCLSPRASRP